MTQQDLADKLVTKFSQFCYSNIDKPFDGSFSQYTSLLSVYAVKASGLSRSLP